MKFNLQSEFKPTGDQPKAIDQLVNNIKSGVKDQVLLGVTGSGKTFTIANVIQSMQKPTLVIAHNKTLAAQLFAEFREFFPDNAVHYFVSYYDYYQPEAYIPHSDTYIEKESDINEEIDRLRHAATHALLTRQDVIIVASVSCIYGLGSPELYKQSSLKLSIGQQISQPELFRQLTEIQYGRSDVDFHRGTFRQKGDIVDIFPAYEEESYRVDFFGNQIESIHRYHPIRNIKLGSEKEILIFPAKHYLAPIEINQILESIEKDLIVEVQAMEKAGKIVEAQRLKQKTSYDLEMIKNTGYCNGIENYSRYFDNRPSGSPPSTLIDFFNQNDYLLVIDESHMTIPQIRGMYNGDQARKNTLIEYGFRLKAARDNRSLKFNEFEKKIHQTIFVSATPSEWELLQARDKVVEQIIRPTGILDPEVEVRSTDNQIEDLLKEIEIRVAKNQRVLVTTLTKRMAEDLTEFMLERAVKVHYLHSEVQTIERSEILQDLRLGKYDVIIGVNLLREGIDLPEVSLVAILDADKEGFLRSDKALIQTIGRAARHIEAKVIMYADRRTDSMNRAIDETNRRKTIQQEYNRKHNIQPIQIFKAIKELELKPSEKDQKSQVQVWKKLPAFERAAIIEGLIEEMRVAAENLDFEKAALIRDQIKAIKSK
ncbi:MAG: UvrABC system protein B [Berkelbacteria bacterium GW2011_GWA2_38_9]|uniref:UvrABC system protein B n=1 Tax=Berkelbacteria bacterium GW2011_GWA2_38_9 TaxID=1618334 RepID=A0A0G0LFI1_9BACT|nr:MAG: UvrABC system protein B [Berkelbacteria bacterium GW2011_GWA2_38_9]